VSRRAFIPAALWVAVHLLVLPWIRNIVTGGDDELERQLRSTYALSSVRELCAGRERSEPTFGTVALHVWRWLSVLLRAAPHESFKYILNISTPHTYDTKTRGPSQ
jgi:hypothetical protein